jgi:hypothetical protein
VVRLEERWAIGQLTRHGSFGLSGFVDAGWVRAGDAPFGIDSGMKVGQVGLLAGSQLASRLSARIAHFWREPDLASRSSLEGSRSPRWSPSGGSDPHAGWEVASSGIR